MTPTDAISASVFPPTTLAEKLAGQLSLVPAILNPPPSATPVASEATLSAILAQLDLLDQRSQSFEGDIIARMTNFEPQVPARLSALDRLPALVQKVNEVVAEVGSLGERFNSLQSEQSDLRKILAALSEAGRPAGIL